MGEDSTRVDRFFRRLQDHPFGGVVLIFCVIIISFAAFTDAVEKLVVFGKKHLVAASAQPNRENQKASGLQSVTPKAALETHPGASSQEQQKRQPSFHTKMPSQANAKPTSTQIALPVMPTTAADLSSDSIRSEGSKNQPKISKELPPEVSGRLTEIPKAVSVSPEPVPVEIKKIVLEEHTKTNTYISSDSPSEPKTQTVAPVVPVVSPREIREVIKVAGSALRGETMSNRVRGVAALLSTLPDDLNAKEIALLAGNETMSSREEVLELLVKRAKRGSLDPNDIPPILGLETMSSRENCIRIVAPYIRPPIAGRHAPAILGSETGGSRVGCLRPIASLLQRPLSDAEVDAILRNTSMSDRTEAIRVLFDQTKDRK